MTNGFIFEIFDFLVRKVLVRLNLVELFKFVAVKTFLHKGDSQIYAVANIAIDVYQIFKWLVLISLWVIGTGDSYSLYIICYLLAFNSFTYFYYEVWGGVHSRQKSQNSSNRRFLNTMLSIFYCFFCYAYLYQIHFYSEIVWPDGIVDFFNAIYLSITTGLTLTYSGFNPVTQFMRLVFLSELLNIFLFITIILSNSIPNKR
ncbi:TPA: hypothetical protein I7732_20640 [Vibrio vulnificus]|nr:hypothetical protein [Vibrio vulnificus]